MTRLERFPKSGCAIEEFPQLPSREVVVAPCRFFYSIEGDPVRIFDVWHTAQIPDEPIG